MSYSSNKRYPDGCIYKQKFPAHGLLKLGNKIIKQFNSVVVNVNINYNSKQYISYLKPNKYELSQ